MAINKKLIHFKNKSKFSEELANNNINDSSICFIQDTQEIWTHGQLYNCAPIPADRGTLAYAEYSDTSATVSVTTKSGYFPETLTEGASIAVKFEGSISYISTLNVNGTGAKNVYYKGNSLTSGSISRYNTYLFVYDGSNYRIIGIDADTHYTAKNVVTSSSTSKSNATATNGNVRLNLIENSTVRSTHQIVGTGATSVTSDSSGNITIDTTLPNYILPFTEDDLYTWLNDVADNDYFTSSTLTAELTNISNAITNKVPLFLQGPNAELFTVVGHVSAGVLSLHIVLFYENEPTSWLLTYDLTSNRGAIRKYSIVDYATKTALASALTTKQDTLVSGETIKTINGTSILGKGNITIDTNPHYIVTSFTIGSLDEYIEQGVTEDIPFTDLQYVQWAFGSKKPVYVRSYAREDSSMYQMTGSFDGDQWYFYIYMANSIYRLEVYDNQTIGYLSVSILPESFKTINGQPIVGTGNIEIKGSNNQSDIYVTRFTMEELWEGIIYAQENVESGFELGIDGQGLTEAIASHKSILIPRADYNGYAQVISVQYDQEDYTYLTIVDNTTTIYIGCSTVELTQGHTLALYNNYITIESVDSEISPNTIVKRDSGGTISASGIWDDSGVLWATESSPEEIQANADYIFQSKIGDIDDIRIGAALGKTALQSYTEQYKGTITGVSANGTSIATSGVANIPAASTSAYGVTKLSSSTSSTSTTLAATASAVKSAYDLANSKQDKLTSGTNIKTVNGQSLLGSGNITIEGGNSDANVQAVDTGDVLDDVETNTYIKYVPQTLTEEQKAQARANIGVGAGSGSNTKWNPEYVGDYSDTSISLDPHKLYYGAAFNNDITINFNLEGSYNEWRIIFYLAPNTSLSTQVDLWANGKIPDISAGGYFELSVVDDNSGVMLGVLAEFKEL